MTVQNLLENVLLVTLSSGLKLSDDLRAINEIIDEQKDCDVIIDFSRAQIITSSNVSNLLILHQLLDENGHRLILCKVPFLVKCVLRVTGLSDFFNYANDKSQALETLKGYVKQ